MLLNNNLKFQVIIYKSQFINIMYFIIFDNLIFLNYSLMLANTIGFR